MMQAQALEDVEPSSDCVRTETSSGFVEVRAPPTATARFGPERPFVERLMTLPSLPAVMRLVDEVEPARSHRPRVYGPGFAEPFKPMPQPAFVTRSWWNAKERWQPPPPSWYRRRAPYKHCGNLACVVERKDRDGKTVTCRSLILAEAERAEELAHSRAARRTGVVVHAPTTETRSPDEAPSVPLMKDVDKCAGCGSVTQLCRGSVRVHEGREEVRVKMCPQCAAVVRRYEDLSAVRPERPISGLVLRGGDDSGPKRRLVPSQSRWLYGPVPPAPKLVRTPPAEMTQRPPPRELGCLEYHRVLIALLIRALLEPKSYVLRCYRDPDGSAWEWISRSWLEFADPSEDVAATTATKSLPLAKRIDGAVNRAQRAWLRWTRRSPLVCTHIDEQKSEKSTNHSGEKLEPAVHRGWRSVDRHFQSVIARWAIPPSRLGISENEALRAPPFVALACRWRSSPRSCPDAHTGTRSIARRPRGLTVHRPFTARLSRPNWSVYDG
jgi:hypothetical protein